MKLGYWLGWIFFRFGFRFYFRWRVFNPERVPPRGPLILAANHASFLDPPLVGSGTTRQIHYLARNTLFRFPVLGAILRQVNALPVDREGGGAAGLRAVLEVLRREEAVLLFPEGTRSPDGAPGAARAGIGLAVIKSGAPVLPVRVFGTYAAFGRHRAFPRPHQVAVKYGRLLTFAQARAEAATCSKDRLKQIYGEVTAAIMTAIAELQPAHDKEKFP